MQNREKNSKILAKEWFLKAQDDEQSAEVLLKEKGSPNTICFLSQQAAEKYLKGYLAFKTREFPKIHDLDRLTKICREIDPAFKQITDDAKFLSLFYIAARYPGDYPQFNFKDAQKAFKKALKIKSFILEKAKL
jgi:HEPN domain-containing protein